MAYIPDWQVKKVIDTFRQIKNIYRKDREETALDRSIAESEKFLNESIK